MQIEGERTRLAEAKALVHRLRKGLGRIRRCLQLDRFDVFTRPVPRSSAFTPPRGYAFRWGTTADVARCDPYHTDLDEHERAQGIARLELGHRVVMAFAGGTPVFSMWVNPRNLHVPGLLKHRLRPDQWFIYKAFTSPEHRGRRLYEAGMRFVLAEMAARDLGELVGYAHTKKKFSRKGLARLGFVSAGPAFRLHLKGREHVRVSRRLARRFPGALTPSHVRAPKSTSGTRAHLAS